MSFEKGLQELIKKSLPEQSSNLLIKRIHELEAESRELKSVKREKEKLKKDIQLIEAEKDQWEDFKVRENELNKRENGLEKTHKELIEKSDRMDIQLISTRLEIMREQQKSTEKLVSLVFGHPNVTIQSKKHELIPVAGSEHTQGYIHEGDSTEITETTHGKKVD